MQQNRCKQHRSSWARRSPPVPLTSSLWLHFDAPPTLVLAWGKDLHGGDHQRPPAQVPLALGREVALSGGFGLPKHLCPPQVKPAAAQYIHLISRDIQSTAYNQESLQEAKPSPSRESLAWQCPQTHLTVGQSSRKTVQVLAPGTFVLTFGVSPSRLQHPMQTIRNTWLFCYSALTFSKEAL